LRQARVGPLIEAGGRADRGCRDRPRPDAFVRYAVLNENLVEVLGRMTGQARGARQETLV